MSISMVGVGACVARVEDAVERGGRRRVDDAAHAVRQLRTKLEHHQRHRARRAGWTRRSVLTGLAPLDRVLPCGGLPCGAVVEILADDLGVGAMSLAMRVAGNSIQPPQDRGVSTGTAPDHRCIVLVDRFGDFYPPAAGRYGVGLDRLVVLRASRAKDAFWAVDQALRCPAVAAVVAPLGKLDERCSRRLQLAAESSGCLGLILMSARRRAKSFAAIQMLVEGVHTAKWLQSPVGGMPSPPSDVHREGRHGILQDRTCLPATWSHGSRVSGVDAGDCHVCRITLLKVREGMPAKPFLVDLQHETGALPVPSVPVDRSVAKTG